MRTRHIVLLLTVAILASVLIAVVGLLYRQVTKYADFEAEKFGFPYYWVEHVKANFGGRTDYWNIEMPYLALNIAFFFVISLAALSLPLFWKPKKLSERN
jgi:hypothetical protein